MISQYRLVRVRCAAAGSGGEKCGTVLGDVPGPIRLVGLAARAPSTPDRFIRLKCSRADCKTWNILEVIAPE